MKYRILCALMLLFTGYAVFSGWQPGNGERRERGTTASQAGTRGARGGFVGGFIGGYHGGK